MILRRKVVEKQNAYSLSFPNVQRKASKVNLVLVNWYDTIQKQNTMEELTLFKRNIYQVAYQENVLQPS